MKITLVAPLLAIDGYGYSAENMALGLKDAGADISFYAQDWAVDKYSKKELLNLRVDKVDADLAIIYHLPPTLALYQHVKTKIAFTMWETTKVPRPWIDCINHYADALFVPSLSNYKVFKTSGIKKPIFIIPLSIDLENYKYIKRDPEPETFKFLMTGKMDIRKNYQGALAAFVEEFSQDEPVEFIVKSRAGAMVNFIPRKNIRIIEDDYTAEQMRDLYYSANCFVYPSRGEGYGLPPREAMATGLPTIITKFSGLEEISNPFMSYPLTNFEMIPAKYPTAKIIGLEGQDFGKWANPDIAELRRSMRYVYSHYKEALNRGRIASLRIHSTITPLNTGRAIKKAIKKLIYGGPGMKK